LRARIPPDFKTTNLITEAAAVIQMARTGPFDMAAILRAVQDLAAYVRLLAGDIQVLKQRNTAFGSMLAIGAQPEIGWAPVGPRGADAKLAAAGVGYSIVPGPGQGPTGPASSN
jgi:hypothetical protein